MEIIFSIMTYMFSSSFQVILKLKDLAVNFLSI